uniref:hypothetical protein n=1 Tax=Thaumasiovibrio occultus TaxID=1891184 RepID=UPI000B359219|nr:hypothetical protein [Thaumasiovibrio occultus]
MQNKIFTALLVGAFILVAIVLSRVEKKNVVASIPTEAPFAVSSAYDGKWEGERMDVSGDAICLETGITGEINEGKVTLILRYNSTVLRGWISEDGQLSLYSTSQRWGYRFSGQVSGDQIKGDWSVDNAPCKGTWYVEPA